MPLTLTFAIKVMPSVFHRTYQNHLKATYSPNRNALFVQVGNPASELLTPIQEAACAARLIFESAKSIGQPIWLCMSGGIDSECMAQAFLAAQVPFQVAIMKFHSHLNDFDIEDAIDFCTKNALSFRLFDFDIIDFLENGDLLEVARKYRCRSPQIAAHLKFLDGIPGYPVLSWNVSSFFWTDQSKSKLQIALPNELYFAYHRYFDLESRPGVGFFFLYTPGLFYSFFHTPTMQDILFQYGEMKGTAASYQAKCQIYQQGGFAVQPRADKFTGFESVKKYYMEKLNSDEGIFNRLFRHPLELLYPDPPQFYCRLSSRFLPRDYKI